MVTLSELKQNCRLSSGCRSPAHQCDVCPFRKVATIFPASDTASKGNGAREALLSIMDGDTQATDFVLAHLWADGFKVVPLGSPK